MIALAAVDAEVKAAVLAGVRLHPCHQAASASHEHVMSYGASHDPVNCPKQPIVQTCLPSPSTNVMRCQSSHTRHDQDHSLYESH